MYRYIYKYIEYRIELFANFGASSRFEKTPYTLNNIPVGNKNYDVFFKSDKMEKMVRKFARTRLPKDTNMFQPLGELNSETFYVL